MERSEQRRTQSELDFHTGKAVWYQVAVERVVSAVIQTWFEIPCQYCLAIRPWIGDLISPASVSLSVR